MWRIFLMAALGAGACSRNGLDLSGTRTAEQELQADPTRALDLLFVVINSASTMEEQVALGRAFPTLMAELATLPGGSPDLHVGVISSDVGAGPVALGSCQPGGDRGVLQTRAACGLDPRSRFLLSSDGGRQTNFAGDLASVFACLVRLGSTGCPFEHHLQAARLALDEAATPENSGFVRPDAHLGIVLLSDDDDCSTAPGTHLFDNYQYKEFSGTFCARAGHMCNGAPLPATGPFKAPFGQCQPSEMGELIPVPDLVTAIRRVKRRPEQLTVAGIFGWPPDEASATYEIATGSMGQMNLAPICQSSQGEAGAGLRLNAFVTAFGGAGVRETICQDEDTATARTIGQRLVERMSVACLDERPADLDASTPGLQPRCEVVERPPGGAGDTALGPCSPQGARPCWALVEDPRCAGSGVRVLIDRAGATAPAGTTQLFRCATCLDAGDPRCRR
jgi:hypothetical protein